MTILCFLLAFAPPELPDATTEDDVTATAPAADAELEDDPDWDEDEPEDAAVVEPAPAPQRPQSTPPAGGPPPPPASTVPVPAPAPAPVPAPAAARTSSAPAEEGWDGKPMDDAAAKRKQEDEQKKGKFGGLKLFRLGIAPKIGYTHGTSDKNGIFDRQKTIDASVMNMGATPTGGGDLGRTRFGGPMYGFEIDLEVFFINVWLDFHKFFRPGGMWSLLIGYDHEFQLHERVRFNLGAGFGMMRVFLGQALADLYYDKSNPEAVNIATAGIEGRLMAGFDFKIAGPLYTGPVFMGGYHYLFSANVDEVTKEKGFHYSGAWNLKLLFELPRNW